MTNRPEFRFLLILLLTFVLFKSGSANDFDYSTRGTTHRILQNAKFISVGDAPFYNPPQKPFHKESGIQNYNGGALQKSNEIDLYIPAGKHFAIRFDSQNHALNLISPVSDSLFSSTVWAAIEKSPRWMKNDLINIFIQLTVNYQEKWAGAINNAVDPFIDEIAFCVAHLSPQYLMSSYASVQLLEENARLIYKNDEFLDYVQVVDYGDSESDLDYWSTTRYRKANFRDTLEVEVPQEIYYWYIVHPKITDEIPAYIDPDIMESNYSHSNNITSADKGFFWRNFLFNYYDPGYSKLKDLLRDCAVVWDEYSDSGNDAMKILCRWIGNSLTFTAEPNERPHQPVRIYRKHFGRCGEHGDMRVAIARAALIPGANVASYSTDHVWNEFWVERWIQWDDDLDNAMVYTDDWGKKFGTVFRWRSDGMFIPVTENYTHEHSIINIYALDSQGAPIDGAQIVLYTTGLDGDLWFDTYGITDSDGKVSFIVGTGRKYYAKMQSELGDVPAGGSENLLRVVVNSRAGKEYSVSMTAPGVKSMKVCSEIEAPQTKNARYFWEINLTVPSQIVQGKALFDDLRSNGTQFISQSGGRINYFMTDEPNYESFLAGQDFEGFNLYSQIDSLYTGFEFEGESDLYAVFDNSNSMKTLQHLKASVNLYSTTDPTIPKVFVLQNFPNPITNGTTITYQLPKKTKVELTIYNILGQKVKTLINKTIYAGEFSVDWDGRNEYNQLVSSGIYVCRIETLEGSFSRKMAVVR
jgi:hypothetical protein